MAMNYPAEAVRRAYFADKKSTGNFSEDDILDLGYSPEDIALIKGKK